MSRELLEALQETLVRRYAKVLLTIEETDGNVHRLNAYHEELELLEDAGLIELEPLESLSYKWKLTSRGREILRKLKEEGYTA